jgi:hypothetical protein
MEINIDSSFKISHCQNRNVLVQRICLESVIVNKGTFCLKGGQFLAIWDIFSRALATLLIFQKCK